MFWRTKAAESRFFYVDVIWGRAYANLFANVSLASRLSPRNLPAMPNNAVSKSIIVTTEEDRALIERHSLFRKLRSLMAVEFLPIQISTQSKYDQMNAGHRQAIEHVGRPGYCVFFGPDAIVADGSMLRLYELARAGCRIVSGFGPSVNQAAFLHAVSSDPTVDTGRIFALPPRKMVELILRHLHVNTSQYDVRSNLYPRQSSVCLWGAPNGDGFLVRALCMHPYLFDTRLVTPGFDLHNCTLDWLLIPRALQDPNGYYVVTDSDELCVCGLQPEGAVEAPPGNGFDAGKVAHYLIEEGFPYLNRNHLLYGVKFHVGDIDDSWVKLERESFETALDVIDPGRALRASLHKPAEEVLARPIPAGLATVAASSRGATPAATPLSQIANGTGAAPTGRWTAANPAVVPLHAVLPDNTQDARPTDGVSFAGVSFVAQSPDSILTIHVAAAASAAEANELVVAVFRAGEPKALKIVNQPIAPNTRQAVEFSFRARAAAAGLLGALGPIAFDFRIGPGRPGTITFNGPDGAAAPGFAASVSISDESWLKLERDSDETASDAKGSAEGQRGAEAKVYRGRHANSSA